MERIDTILEQYKQHLALMHKHYEMQQLFIYWGEKLDLPKDASVGEFMDKLKLYQNLHPED